MNLEQRWPRSALLDQFVLSRDASRVPDDWLRNPIAGWAIGTHPSLLFATIVDAQARTVGFFAGYVIDDRGRLLLQP